jgi:hypothetical protein
MTVEIDNSGGAAVQAQGPNSRIGVMYNRVDFTETANALATTLSMGIFTVPMGVRVLNVFMHVIQADADVSDVDVGIEGGTEDGFIDGATIATVGIKDDVDEAYSTPGNGFFDVDDDQVIALKNNDADTINGAIIDFFATYVDTRNPND